MKIEQKKSALMQERKIRFWLTGISGALFCITLMQAIAIVVLLRYAHGKHETHFIPPQISGAFSISRTGVSEGYLMDMSSYHTQLRFNVTQSSVTRQFNALLGHVHASLYGELRAQLVKEVEQINHEHLSAVFYPLDFDTDIKNLGVKVSGTMRRFVGGELMSEVKETFLVKYVYEAGLLKITNLEKVER